MLHAFLSINILILRPCLSTFATNKTVCIMELRVKEICQAKGIALKDIAEHLNITYQAFFASLNGNPTIGRLQEIADYLNVELVELFPRTNNSAAIICPHCGKPVHIKVG